MAQIDGFNTNDYKGYQLLPAGDYNCVVISTSFKPTKSTAPEARNNKQLVLEIQVADGPRQNHKFKLGLNYFHHDPETARIGRGKFSDICRAVGIQGAVTDTDQVCFKKFSARIKIKQGSNGYQDSNDITSARPCTGTVPPGNSNGNGEANSNNNGGNSQTQGQPAAAGAPSGGARPW